MLQYTDDGDCFSDATHGSHESPNDDVVVQIAATTECPRQLIRRKVANSQKRCFVFFLAVVYLQASCEFAIRLDIVFTV